MAKIAIFGLGPGGICAMLEALEKGHTVDVFEKRAAFTRTNAIFLRKEMVQLLETTHHHFSDWLQDHPQYTEQFKKNTLIYQKSLRLEKIEIREFQTYIFNLIPLLKDKYPGRLKIHAPIAFSDDELGFNTITPDGTLFLSDPQSHEIKKIQVDHIICAEGSNRQVAKNLGFRFKSIPQPIYPYWVKFTCDIAYNFMLESYSPEETRKKSEEMGFTGGFNPTRWSLHSYSAMQVPSWIMFLPSQEKQNSAIKRWVSHMTFLCNTDCIAEKKILTPEQIILEDHPLFIITHTLAIASQLFRTFPKVTATVIGDARETTFFGGSYGVNHAMRAAKHYINYASNGINKKQLQQFDQALQRENTKKFGSYHSQETNHPLHNKEYTEKWIKLIQSLGYGPYTTGHKKDGSIIIKCKTADFKPKFALFLRFILKIHANGWHDHFFQNLLNIDSRNSSVQIIDAHVIIELLDLYINLKLSREGFQHVTLEEFNTELLSLQQQFRTFSEQKKPILYPEMTADALFEYLKVTSQLKLIGDIIKSAWNKPNLVGLTVIQGKDDLCSLYDVIDYHFDNRSFFAKLRSLYLAELPKKSTNIFSFFSTCLSTELPPSPHNYPSNHL